MHQKYQDHCYGYSGDDSNEDVNAAMSAAVIVCKCCRMHVKWLLKENQFTRMYQMCYKSFYKLLKVTFTKFAGKC
jgi:hypothetical protein